MVIVYSIVFLLLLTVKVLNVVEFKAFASGLSNKALV